MRLRKNAVTFVQIENAPNFAPHIIVRIRQHKVESTGSSSRLVS